MHRPQTLRRTEEAAGSAGVSPAMPVPSWVLFGGKATALMVVAVVYLGVGIATTIGIQLYHGYDHLELPVYAQGFVVQVLPFLLVAILAVFLQVAAGNKFIGYLLMILYLLSKPTLDALGAPGHEVDGNNFSTHAADFVRGAGETPALPALTPESLRWA